ncbi:MAG TPA: helix-turn-helix domain-containing protein, partial [Caulobacteraceae bacterium]|nr:helix-turn-helix domain-containing protein [Caulobacteraceae bacterium]
DRGIDPAPTLERAASLGAGLRAVREYYRLTLEDVALGTCVRKLYLQGIEDMRLEGLPSRPFVIGYVRAYADALGLDPDRAVARFKMEFPDDQQQLRAPVGVARETDRRLRPMIIGAVLVVLAFVAWNIARHAVSKGAHPPAAAAGTEVAASSAKVRPASTTGPISVGAPLPAPQESTLPAPYVTPGLAPSTTAAAARPAPPPPAAGTPFQVRGTIYGAPAGQSVITLQANKSASLIVRGGDGTVYFARQLSSGEAYRAPQTGGLAIEVSDPAVFNVFVGGLLKGPLPAAQIALSKLTQN